MKMKPNWAWHFVADKLRDGSPVPKDGDKLVFKGQPVLCEQGLHWSKDPFDVLQYAPGNTLCLVEYGGIVVTGSDKGCSTERTIIMRMDAEEMLRYFARMQALSVIDVYPNGEDEVVFDYLMTGDESIRAAARAAAMDAAWVAAWVAAWAAAWAAARDAQREYFNHLVYECFGIEESK